MIACGVQDALGVKGRSCLCVLMCAVCPAVAAAEETLHTLKFAARARSIELGAAQRVIAQRNIEEVSKRTVIQLAVAQKQLQSLERELVDAAREKAVAESHVQQLLSQGKRSFETAKSFLVAQVRRQRNCASWPLRVQSCVRRWSS